jgi:hypothetical protein
VEEGEGGVDCIVKVGIGMVESQDDARDGE